MSRKSERLINLTIALLATRRFLTKSEIFGSIDGYEGSNVTKERMFERDKDDLRNLGIEIELGSFDPIFDDEAGYRIRPENYSLQLGKITGVEMALLSLAAEAWRGAALDPVAHSALTKLNSIGIQSDLDAVPAISPRMNAPQDEFLNVVTAIAQRRSISFDYISETLKLESRTLEPFAIAIKDSYWYVAGNDVAKQSIRTFRLDRIDGQIIVNKYSSGYVIPEGFDIFVSLTKDAQRNVATIDIRKGKAELLRTTASSIEEKGEWDRITINYLDSRHLIDLVLWHGEDALILAPDILRSEIIERLQEIVALHG